MNWISSIRNNQLNFSKGTIWRCMCWKFACLCLFNTGYANLSSRAGRNRLNKRSFVGFLLPSTGVTACLVDTRKYISSGSIYFEFAYWFCKRYNKVSLSDWVVRSITNFDLGIVLFPVLLLPLLDWMILGVKLSDYCIGWSLLYL